jgi:hypothetical protein
MSRGPQGSCRPASPAPIARCRPAPTATGSHHDGWSNAPALSQRVKSRRPSLTRAGRQASKQPVPPAPDPLLADLTSRETDIPGSSPAGNSIAETAGSSISATQPAPSSSPTRPAPRADRKRALEHPTWTARQGAFSRDRAVPRREPVLRMFLGWAASTAVPVPFGVRSRTKAPLPDVMPGRFTGAVFVAEEKCLGAGFDAAAGQRCRTCVAVVADGLLGGLLWTGYDPSPVPARPAGLARALPGRGWWAGWWTQARHSGGGSDQVQGSEGQGQGDVHH